MDWQNNFNSFIFNNNEVVYRFINPISIIELLTIINDWQFQFSQNLSTAFTKFVHMALLIGSLQKTRTKLLVDFIRCINNVFGNSFNVVHYFLAFLIETTKHTTITKDLILFLRALSALSGSFLQESSI